jgi:ABC-type thiamin/hydroxymethylpyrimidine transport system permease subunit
MNSRVFSDARPGGFLGGTAALPPDVNMRHRRAHFFSLHELLVMAALAALGGVTSAAMSMVRAAAHAALGFPGGMQFLAGLHVLWLVLAVGLVRKPGAAIITGLLKGAVELLSGNPHGLLVVLYCALAGLGVDAVWLLLGRRHHPITYVLAGGVGSASNVLVLPIVASLPGHRAVVAGATLLAGIAFVSGVVLAGLLGWWLLAALGRAGVVGVRADPKLLADPPAIPSPPDDTIMPP